MQVWLKNPGFIFAALIFVGLFAHMPDLGGDTPTRLLFGWAILFALIGFFGVYAANEKHLIVPLPVLTGGILAPLFFGIYGACGASMAPVFVWTPALVFLSIALLFVALANYRWSEKTQSRLVSFCVLAQTLLLFGSGDYPLLAFIPGPVAWPSAHAFVHGGYWQVNVMANVLACLALWAAYDTARPGPVTRLHLLRGLAAFILFPLVIGWARSGSGALGLMSGLAIMAVVAWHQSGLFDRRKISVILTLIVAGFLVAAHFGLGVDTAPDVTAKIAASSAPDRIGIWMRALYAFGEAPLFGHGLGYFGAAYNEAALAHAADIPYRWIDNTRHAHNLILHWLVEIGLVGTAIILAPFIWFAIALLRHTPRHWASLAIIAPLLGHMMLGYPQRQSGVVFILIVLVIVHVGHASGWPQALSVPLRRIRPVLRFAFVAAISVPLILGALASGVVYAKASSRHMVLASAPFHRAMVAWRLTHADMRHPFLGYNLQNQAYFALTLRAMRAQDKEALRVLLPVLRRLEREALRGAPTWHVLVRGYLVIGAHDSAAQIMAIADTLAPDVARRLALEMEAELKPAQKHIIRQIAPNHRPAGR